MQITWSRLEDNMRPYSLLTIGDQNYVEDKRFLVARPLRGLTNVSIFFYNMHFFSFSGWHDYSISNHGPLPWTVESVQDFLIKLDMKPCMYLVEISIYSLNHVIVRLTKIMKNLLKHLKIRTFKVLGLCYILLIQMLFLNLADKWTLFIHKLMHYYFSWPGPCESNTWPLHKSFWFQLGFLAFSIQKEY